MSSRDLLGVEEDLDRLTTQLLVPLRMSKSIEEEALKELCALVERLEGAIAESGEIPVKLCGKLWFIFTSMLSEAGHARNPEPILDAAWEYQECLSHFFGPHF